METDPRKFSPEDAMRMANTPAGKQLIAMLKKADNAVLQDAMKQASNGDMEKIKQTLAPLLASPEVQKLIKQLGGK